MAFTRRGKLSEVVSQQIHLREISADNVKRIHALIQDVGTCVGDPFHATTDNILQAYQCVLLKDQIVGLESVFAILRRLEDRVR